MKKPRRIVALVGVLVALAWSVPKRALAGDAFALRANQITFYSDRYLLVGRGDVELQRPDGTRLRGDYFAMNLRLNRYVLAGNVVAQTPAGELKGAAFSEYLDQHRIYFIPVTSEPDRWTFLGDDFAHPLRGREMPGDAFDLPGNDLGAAYVKSNKALIVPHQSVRFTPAQLSVQGVFVPLPDYFYLFSENPNFAENSLSGAEFDGPFPFAGGEHSLSTAHLRYDQFNGLYLAFEQHWVSNHSYIVTSINPLTRPQKQYNLIGFDRLSPVLQVHGFVQESTFQHGFSQPLTAGGVANLQLTLGLRHSFLQLTGDQFYESLLADPAPINGLKYYGDPSHNFVPDHPSDAFLTWTGVDHRLGYIPLYFRVRSGYGFAHNGITPEQRIGASSIPTIFEHFAGITLYSPSFRINRDKHHRDTFLNFVFDKQRTWFSLPHFIDAQTSTASISKQFSPKFSAFVDYSISNIGDFWGAQQSLVYPQLAAAPVSPLNGQSYPDYLGFHGFATTRSLVEGITFAPSPNLSGSIQMRENHDFPVPIPEPTSRPQIGVAPLQATADVRIRLNNNLLIDLSRSYYFGFGSQYFSPQFNFLLSQ
ncbi:MAG: hypothetical protein ACREM8_04625 [Vulcanimicrobiaceae bacterium]